MTDLKGYPQAMVPHCSFFNGKGYDPNRAMVDHAKGLTYFTNNLILLDIKKYRESDYPDKMLNYYQKQANYWGFDPHLLSQDL